MLWLTAFFEYCSKFVVIASAATYYWDSDPSKEGSANVGVGFRLALVNHAGSIAFGAFIIALVRFIKFVFYYICKKLQKASGDSAFVKCVVGCGTCILNCIERICDYLNEAAFAYQAVTGRYFLPSAWEGFLLNLKHVLKFSFANTIAKVFMFIGKCGIVMGNTILAFFVLGWTGDREEVESSFGPIVVCAVLTYYTASLFIELFDTTVMSMTTCLAIDMDLHGGEH